MPEHVENNPGGKPEGRVEDFMEAAECLKTLRPCATADSALVTQRTLHRRRDCRDCEVLDNVASEHLRLLQRCGFLGSERDGRRVYYHVAEPHLEQLMACIAGRFLDNSNELTDLGELKSRSKMQKFHQN